MTVISHDVIFWHITLQIFAVWKHYSKSADLRFKRIIMAQKIYQDTKAQYSNGLEAINELGDNSQLILRSLD